MRGRSPPPPDTEQELQVIEIDEAAEEKKEHGNEEVCLVNGALCNLKMAITAYMDRAYRA